MEYRKFSELMKAFGFGSATERNYEAYKELEPLFTKVTLMANTAFVEDYEKLESGFSAVLFTAEKEGLGLSPSSIALYIGFVFGFGNAMATGGYLDESPKGD